MNTDASNVEDMNIPHVKECLLLSCVASFEDWSGIFRTRSFTLFRNDRDLRERFDSATTTGLPVLSSINSSDFHS